MCMNKIIKAYKNNPNFKGRIIVVMYVIMRFFRVRMTSKISIIVFSPIIIFYKFITDFLLKCEIPASTIIGDGLIIHHATSLVLNSQVKIGNNVTLNHNTTIGNKIDLDGNNLGCPVIGNNVKIAPHCILIGPINIGDNSIIGAGSVVVKDVPPNTIVAGNPAKILSYFK